MDSASILQHPRRNLGSRHRSQADRFVKLARKDPERKVENLAWAEQNAQQAVLHDFTDERNWRCLAEIKHMREDGEGLSLVLEDLFVVLGRDPNQLNQLKDIDHLELGLELLEAAFLTDSLEPENWFEKLDQEGLNNFSVRCKGLDFSDSPSKYLYVGSITNVLVTSGKETFTLNFPKAFISFTG